MFDCENAAQAGVIPQKFGNSQRMPRLYNMKEHELKIWPEQFEAVKSGIKRFEFQKNDRDFQVGDLLRLRKFYPCVICQGTGRDYTYAGSQGGQGQPCDCGPLHGEYGGSEVRRKVLYIMDKGFNLPNGYIILGLADQ